MESAENQPQPKPDRAEVNKADTDAPRSKMATIALLNASIDRLEETIRRISEDSVQIPPPDSMDNLLSTAQELEDAVTAIESKIAAPEIPEPKTPEPTPSVQPPASTATAKQTPPSQKAVTPPPRSRKNLALIISAVTAIAIAIVTLFWLQPEFITNLLPQEAAPAPQVAVSLDEATEKLVKSEQPTDNVSNGALDETSESDADLGIIRDISAMDFPEAIESVAEPIEDVVETVIPTELTSPSRPKNLKMVAIEPKLNFTPEQNLVGAIAVKLSDLSQGDSDALVEDIQINLPESSLVVRVSDDWYELDEASQDSIGQELLQRSRRFGFNRLELKDRLDTLVARSPIIGNNIILQSTTK